MKNQRYYLTAPRTLEMKEEIVPHPGQGELLVRIRAALTCGTDMKMLQRGHPKLSLPAPFGHEASGVVEAIGRDVADFKEGDRVMFPISAPCGKCAYCALGRENLCTTLMKEKLWGTFATYIIVPAHIASWQTYRIPRDISFPEAALLDPFASVVFSWQSIPLRPPGPVVILGTGAIAYMHVLLAFERGFSPVIIAGRRSQRFSAFKELGTQILHFDETIVEGVRDLTDGLGAEVVIDTTGAPEVWGVGLALCRGGGTYMAFAGCEEGTEACLDTTLLHYEQLTVVGSFHYDRQAVAATYGAITSRKYPLLNLFSGTYSLADLPDALEEVKAGRGFKYVIEP